MKVYLDPGHGGYDNGAVKYITEDKVNLAMALACRDYLKANGVEVKMSRTADTGTSISKSAAAANDWGADIVVSIHNNAGGGEGFEAFHGHKSANGKKLAGKIENRIEAIGQKSRGLKTKVSNGTDYFGIIRLTKAPAVITETVFVDNKKDAAKADTAAEQKKFGEAIAKGILDYFGVSAKAPTAAQASKAASYKVKVTVSALNVRKGAGTSYDVAMVIRDKGTYTIVETKGDWGKLKSGKGWINLDYTKKV